MSTAWLGFSKFPGSPDLQSSGSAIRKGSRRFGKHHPPVRGDVAEPLFLPPTPVSYHPVAPRWVISPTASRANPALGLSQPSGCSAALRLLGGGGWSGGRSVAAGQRSEQPPRSAASANHKEP